MKTVYLITSGDLREEANRLCWPAQEALEYKLAESFAAHGVALVRASAVDPARGHGFVRSQREGMDIFLDIPADAPLVFATAAWQYSHHVLPGLRNHKGPLLTVANWSGTWPGLVGLLNLNGSLVKAGVPFSTLWSETLEDDFFLQGVATWLREGRIAHDLSHVRDFATKEVSEDDAALAKGLATELRCRKAILGVFDEGCMGMYNAILDDELLNPLGIFKERLSQSALVAEMRSVRDEEAEDIRRWLIIRGVSFKVGSDERTELTMHQIIEQCKMYIAAVRIADRFGCDAIGIQYQQGLKDMTPASDLVEGLLNNPDRPPVRSADGRVLFEGAALPHFNEVDEGAGVDALITNLLWKARGWDPSTTLHDIRWGEDFALDPQGEPEFIWLLQISGAAPASHFVDGYRGAVCERQPAMFFPLGGGTLKGVGRPGVIVWSRVFQEQGQLHVDIGLGDVLELPSAETERRWSQVNIEWPIVHARLRGITRDALMARHRANHISIAYVPSNEEAGSALMSKAAMFHELDVQVHLCGVTPEGQA